MKQVFMSAIASLLLVGCSSGLSDDASNPFFSDYNTPFGVPPFELIKAEHYKPAFMKGMEQQLAEIDAIVNNAEPATFENTIAALDQSGALLNKVSYVFFGQTNANTNDELNAINKDMSPLLSAHSDKINMNAKLFERIKFVYDHHHSWTTATRFFARRN